MWIFLGTFFKKMLRARASYAARRWHAASHFCLIGSALRRHSVSADDEKCFSAEQRHFGIFFFSLAAASDVFPGWWLRPKKKVDWWLGTCRLGRNLNIFKMAAGSSSLSLTWLFLDEFRWNAHRSIALKPLDLTSFEFKTIRWSLGPQIPSKRPKIGLKRPTFRSICGPTDHLINFGSKDEM